MIRWLTRRRSKILYLLRNQKNHYWYDPYYVLSKDGEENLIQNVRELAFAIIPLPACVNPDLKLNPKLLAGVSMELHSRISVFATDSFVQEVLSPSEDESKERITWADLEVCDVFIRMDQSKIEQWGSIMRLTLVQLVVYYR